jgi:hypothetical protein
MSVVQLMPVACEDYILVVDIHMLLTRNGMSAVL